MATLMEKLGLMNDRPVNRDFGTGSNAAYQTPEEIAAARRWAEAVGAPTDKTGNLKRTEHWTQLIAHILGAMSARGVYNATDAALSRNRAESFPDNTGVDTGVGAGPQQDKIPLPNPIPAPTPPPNIIPPPPGVVPPPETTGSIEPSPAPTPYTVPPGMAALARRAQQPPMSAPNEEMPIGFGDQEGDRKLVNGAPHVFRGGRWVRTVPTQAITPAPPSPPELRGTSNPIPPVITPPDPNSVPGNPVGIPPPGATNIPPGPIKMDPNELLSGPSGKISPSPGFVPPDRTLGPTNKDQELLPDITEGRSNLGVPPPSEAIAPPPGGGNTDATVTPVQNAGPRIHQPSGLPIFEDRFAGQPPPSVPPIPNSRLNAMGYLSESERKGITDNWTLQHTPTWTEVPGGRVWRLPNGQEGYVPTLHRQPITIGGDNFTTVTIRGRDGTRQTYIELPTGEVVPPAGANAAPGARSSSTNPYDNPDIQAMQESQARLAAGRQSSTESVTSINREIDREIENLPVAQQTASIVGALTTIMNNPQGRSVVRGNWGPQLTGLMNSINGVVTAAGRAPLFDPDRISAAEMIIKLNTYLGSAAARQLTNRPTQFDFQAFIAANPGLATSAHGARILTGILGAFAQREIALANAASNVRDSSAGTLNIPRWTQARNSVYDTHTLNAANIIMQAAADTANLPPRERVTIPQGFIYNGRRFLGGNPADPNRWVVNDRTEIPIIRR